MLERNFLLAVSIHPTGRVTGYPLSESLCGAAKSGFDWCVEVGDKCSPDEAIAPLRLADASD